MAESIKFWDNRYLDSSGVSFQNEKLSDRLWTNFTGIEAATEEDFVKATASVVASKFSYTGGPFFGQISWLKNGVSIDTYAIFGQYKYYFVTTGHILLYVCRINANGQLVYVTKFTGTELT